MELWQIIAITLFGWISCGYVLVLSVRSFYTEISPFWNGGEKVVSLRKTTLILVFLSGPIGCAILFTIAVMLLLANLIVGKGDEDFG